MPTRVSVEFPYEAKRRRTGLVLSPYVELDIRTKGGKFVSHRFIFDTGADFTSFPKYMAEVAGVNLEECTQETMYTANNEPMTTYCTEVKTRFGEKLFNLPCVFTDRNDTPFLLGRVGFIDKFDMHLLASERKLVFEEV